MSETRSTPAHEKSLRELRATKDELRGCEDLLRDFVENAAIGLNRIGPDGTILWANRAELELLGYAAEEYVGRHIADFHDHPHVARDIIARLNREESLRNHEAHLRAKDGSIKHVLISSSAYRRDGKLAYSRCFTHDITERRKEEVDIRQREQELQLIFTITAAIADAVTSEQVFEALVDHVAVALDASSTALWLVDEESAAVQLVRAWGLPDDAKQRLASIPLVSTESTPTLDCIRRQEPVWISERSYRGAYLPLIAHGGVLGALVLTLEETREASADERDFFLLVARYASQALERLRLFEAERRSRSEVHAAALRLGILSHASRAFVESDLDFESRLRGVVAALGTALESAVGITLVQPDGLLHTAAVHHPDPEAQELLRRLGEASPLRMGEGITGAVAESGKSILIPSIEPEALAARAAPAYRAFIERYPIYAMICAPLRVEGRVIGAVTATQPNAGNSYSNEDLHLFEELAERAAVAIQSSRLYQETLDARSRAEQLYRFAQAVVSADTIEKVFDAALASIEAAVGTKRAAILTFDSDGVLRFKAWHNLSEAYRSSVEGHSPWPPDTVTHEPVVIPDAASDPAMAAYLPLFRREGIGALAFIPLVTGGRLLGKFMVYYAEPHAFASHELETAKAIANHLASVITRFFVVAKLQETIRYNEIFAGVLAHDLRNPLGAIMQAAQLLLMRREGESVKGELDEKPASRILASGQRMTRMIDQLLDFTSARSGGGIDIHRRETNLADLCAQAVGELELAHPEWKIDCEIVGDPGGTWDADRLLQVISNLLANAGQHGRAGGTVYVKLDGTEADEVTFEVHNKGTVPASLLPQLFDPFRSTRHQRVQSRGLGLGLFIVREIVRAHGGTVEVVSSEPLGTTFSIRLPRSEMQRVSS